MKPLPVNLAGQHDLGLPVRTQEGYRDHLPGGFVPPTPSRWATVDPLTGRRAPMPGPPAVAGGHTGRCGATPGERQQAGKEVSSAPSSPHTLFPEPCPDSGNPGLHAGPQVGATVSSGGFKTLGHNVMEPGPWATLPEGHHATLTPSGLSPQGPHTMPGTERPARSAATGGPEDRERTC